MEDLENESNCLEWATRKGMVYGRLRKEIKLLGVVNKKMNGG